jgi:hypothetical protein
MTEIALTQARRGATSNEATSEGEVAASVFERFDRGATPNEVVAELVLAVDTVEYLWRGCTAQCRSRPRPCACCARYCSQTNRYEAAPMLRPLFDDLWSAHPNNALDARVGSLNTARRAQHKKHTRPGSEHGELARSETVLGHVHKKTTCWSRRYAKPRRTDVTLWPRLASS